MSNHPLEQLNPQVPGSESPASTANMGKRGKFRPFLGIPKSKSKEVKPNASNQSLSSRPPSQLSTRPPSIVSQVSNYPCGDSPSATSSYIAKVTKPQSLPQSAPPHSAQAVVDIFPENVPMPTIKTEAPQLQERIESTEKLVYCYSLLLQDSLLSVVAVPGEEIASDTAALVLQDPILNKAVLDWLEEVKKDPMEREHLRWLVTRMVEVFVADTTKGLAELAEVVALGPVLQREHYHKLLLSLIKDFDEAHILDVNLLQGLVELVQSASPDFLDADYLVKILSILRVRLQDTHQQSTEHSYHLTLAVSKVLDIMADHKVQDLDCVLEHEPLWGVLSGLKGSTDPYLVYQACYAFQALQYVPDDESALQAILRHSTGVVDGLVKISAVFKLDLASVLEGLSGLQESVGGIAGVATSVYEGVSSLMECGRGVFVSLKEDLSTGQKRPWYPAIKAAYAFAQAGQLKDLKHLILEAHCRRDPLFQWGICQLLGEIALDPIWADATRQQAVGLLGHLYINDPDWDRDDSVKTWMLTIITNMGNTSDQIVNAVANALLQDLALDKSTSIQHPYPLMARLPIPSSSPVLTKVQNIPPVDYDLNQLRLQRIKEAHPQVYIPPMAKANLQARDDDPFPLMDKVEEFLASDRQVMLILGDSGSGKSTFSTYLESLLLRAYVCGGRIPLFINLAAIDEPQQDMIEKQLRFYNFSDDQIKELKLHREFILICDGYDESQQLVNLHWNNKLNQPGQWKTKMIISCRSQYLGQDYQSRFAPIGGGHYNRPALGLFHEAVIVPFSEKQIQDYVEQYVPLEPRTWTTQDYMDKLAIIPNLMDLVKNPFVLTLALEALPLVIEGKQDLSAIKVTRVQLYDIFVVRWLDVNKRRLEGMALSDEDRGMLDQLLDADFISMGTEYSTNLASAIFEHQGGNPVVRYVHLKDKATWRAEFFRPDPEVRLLLESSPLTRTGSLFRFLHRSMQEYFYSRAAYDPSSYDDTDEVSLQLDRGSPIISPLDPRGPLLKQNLLDEPTVIQFLCERVKQHPAFEKQLRAIVELSKTDPTAAGAAANAMTILVQAGVRFNGTDLRGIRISGADISGGEFDSAQLQGADLTGVNLARSWLRQADIGGAQMDDVRFGELPYLKTKDYVTDCAYSPNGKFLAVGSGNGDINVYDTTAWTRVHQYSKLIEHIFCINFSPDSQRLVFGDLSNNLQLWDITSDDILFDMEGHSDEVTSVAFSPCGKQIASASIDQTVRLWSVETGEALYILEGHKDDVCGVAYTLDGQRLISADRDGKIRVWDPETGEPVACWNIPNGVLTTLALSSDGQRAAVSLKGDIHITNTITGEPGPVLHVVDQISCVTFSSDGQWIAGRSSDNTVGLWDISTSRLISRFPGHTNEINVCAFSPNCSQIVSGDKGGYVRLWGVDNTKSILDPNGPSAPISAVTFCPDGRHILSSNENQGLRQWDSTTGGNTPLSLQKCDYRWSFALSPNGEQIAIGSSGGDIQLWSRQADAMERTLSGHCQTVNRLTYSPCGRWIVSIQDSYALLWDLHDDEDCDKAIIWIQEDIEFYCAAFTRDGLFVLGTNEYSLYLHDPRSQDPGTPVMEISLDSPSYSLDCSPDGEELALGMHGGTVRLWNFESDEPGIELYGRHNGRVNSVAYSPCGEWILSGSEDKTVRLWIFGEDACWSCVAVVVAGCDEIASAAWNPVDSIEFVTGCRDGSVRVWQMSSVDDSGDLSVQMLWGNSVGPLCASDLTFKGATGLSPIYLKLLIQCGAIDDPLCPEGGVAGEEVE